MIVQRFNLNLIPNQSPVIVHVNQYDTGTGRLVATLYEGNEPYSPSGTAVIQGTKPDGHGFQYTATLDGNVVTADLTEQMAPVAGDVRTQIVVTEPSGVTGTFAFIMRVQPSALPSDTDMSESDYQYIEEAIREAQEAVQTAQEATETAQEAVERAQEAIAETQENAEDSEAWAQGTRGGIPVGPTDPTYEHNAEYWAHQAEGAASGVSSFNGRSGSVLPMAGDYDSEKILLASVLHIGGETQENVQKALEALSNDGVKSFNGRSGSVLPMAGDYSAEQVDYDSNQTVKQKIDALVTKEASDIAGQQSLVKDTVGWTGKNLADNSKTISMDGASTVFSLNDNGGFSLSGSIRYLASLTPLSNLVVGEQYIASIKVVSSTNSDARLTLRDSTNQIRATKMFGTTPGVYELPFTYQDGWYLSVICNFTATQSSMEIEEIMVRKADIIDPTYEPYHESVEEVVEQIYADNGVLGAKNLLKNNATSQTINGVTFTVNADGSVTANGTATANASVTIATYLTLPTEIIGQNVILTGCPEGGSTNGKYFMNAIGFRSASSGDTDTGNGVQINNVYDFTANTATMVYIEVRSGYNAQNLTFKPMLRLASDPDDTYQPYAMTNRELTEKVFEKRTLTNSDNLNNITETGIYGITTIPANFPEATSDYCTLIVQKTAASDIRQIIIRSANAAAPRRYANIYTRSYGGNPLAWTPWYKFTGTVVS